MKVDKLDSRIIDGKKPLTFFDSDEAKKFIGQKGFFSDYATHFNNLNNLHRSTLLQVYGSEAHDFDRAEIFADESGCSYMYFLPEEYVMTEDECFAFSDNAELIASEICHLIKARISERKLESYGLDGFVNEIIMKLRIMKLRGMMK